MDSIWSFSRVEYEDGESFDKKKNESYHIYNMWFTVTEWYVFILCEIDNAMEYS